MKRRWIRAAASLLVASTVVAGAWTPARAADTVELVGGGGWGGVASMPLYPCPLGCMMSFSGYFDGNITVYDATTNRPTYTATWVGTEATPNLSAGPLSYTESCGGFPIPPLTGSASGPFTVSGGVLEPPSPSGSTVAQLTGSFALTRVGGAFLLLTVSGAQLLDGNGTVLASAQSTGAGVGFLIGPVQDPSTLPFPPDCAHEVPVKVALVGAYAQPT